MKRIVGCLALLCLVSVGSLIPHVTAEAPAPVGSTQSSAAETFAGQDVRVYFRQEVMPTMPPQWRRGVVTRTDDRFITLSMSNGETLWVPLASVAYVESSKAATTRPN